MGASFVRIFALLSSVPEITSEPRSWNTCLVIHNKPIPLQLGSLISDFQKTPKTGDSLPGQLSRSRMLELSGPPLERGWGLNPSLMVSDIMNHAYEMNPCKTPKGWVSENFQAGAPDCFHIPSIGPQTLRGQKLLCLGSFPVYLFIWLLLWILCNKLVI